MKNFVSLSLIFAILSLVGCANDSTDDLIEPPVVPVVYNGIIGEFFNTHCASCHGSEQMEAALSLHTYESVVLGINARGVLGRITNQENPMPPSGLLPSELTDLIFEWRDNDFPQNPPPEEGEEK